MTLVIMAAGMGSRYGGLKQIDPITDGGAFILDFSVYDAIVAGFDRVVFVIKEENYALFKETVGARIEDKIECVYAFQRLDDIPTSYTVPQGRVRPWGTGHAVLSAREAVGEDNFAVINADDFYGRDAFLRLGDFLRTAKPSADGVEPFCMIGYALENTLTDHGTVSRGVCSTDADGYLTGITERTKIMRTETGAAYLEGDNCFALPADTTVSMNCWGFTPAAMRGMEQGFAAFLAAEEGDPLKREFYLPSAVEQMMGAGVCRVQVLNTDAIWQGVTYPEDKPTVVEGIRRLIQSGVYPPKLW
ncbi:MAG: nucleotidyltransferase [Clostridia bacterium]|nr:nucleotidyltransferase [Clostridia bacterium]